jgi:hypothetical protein
VLEGDMSGDVYQVILPATSIFGRGQGTQQLPLEAYARMLHGNRVGVDSVITKMEFDTDSSTPKLVFSPVRFLEENEQAIVDRQADTPEAEQAIGLNAYQTDAAAKAAPAPAIAAPVAAPAPVEKPKAAGFQPVAPTADEEEAIPEPVKATPVDADARSAKIANVLDAWGD